MRPTENSNRPSAEKLNGLIEDFEVLVLQGRKQKGLARLLADRSQEVVTELQREVSRLSNKISGQQQKEARSS